MINAETETVLPTNFRLGKQLEHPLSTAMANYKSLYEVECTRAGTYRVAPHSGGHANRNRRFIYRSRRVSNAQLVLTTK